MIIKIKYIIIIKLYIHKNKYTNQYINKHINQYINQYINKYYII